MGAIDLERNTLEQSASLSLRTRQRPQSESSGGNSRSQVAARCLGDEKVEFPTAVAWRFAAATSSLLPDWH